VRAARFLVCSTRLSPSRPLAVVDHRRGGGEKDAVMLPPRLADRRRPRLLAATFPRTSRRDPPSRIDTSRSADWVEADRRAPRGRASRYARRLQISTRGREGRTASHAALAQPSTSISTEHESVSFGAPDRDTTSSLHGSNAPRLADSPRNAAHAPLNRARGWIMKVH
jgi:hypothetical protein